MKFVIVSPKQTSGGSMALHALYKHLDDLGQDARIFYIPVPLDDSGNNAFSWPTWIAYTVLNSTRKLCIKLFGEERFLKKPGFRGLVNLTVRDCKIKHTPFVGKNTIVIYPESVFGNPLHAQKVVRWLLYFNRFKDNEEHAYDKGDLFVCYRKIFNDKHLNPHEYQVHANYFNLDLYKRTNYGNRSGRCYFIRKGKDRDDLPEEFDGPILDDLSETEKVKIMNESETCISYDTQTAYSSIAALCGCLSIVVPEPGKTRSDYVSEEDLCPGIAYGFSEDQIEFAKETSNQVLEDFLLSDQTSRDHVKRFIRLCKRYFFEDQNRR